MEIYFFRFFLLLLPLYIKESTTKKVKISRTILILLTILIHSTPAILYANQESEDGRIHLVESLIDNSLVYSQEVTLHHIIEWEEDLVEIYSNKKEYTNLFLVQQMASFALATDGKLNEALEKANNMFRYANKLKYDIGIAISHYALGDTYLMAEMADEAIKEYTTALSKLQKTSGTNSIKEKVLIRLIPTLIRIKEMDDAQTYINQLKDINDGNHSRFVETINQTYYHLRINDTDNAYKYLKESEEWYKRYPFYSHGYILMYIKAEYAKNTGNNRYAIKLYNEFLKRTDGAKMYTTHLKIKNTLAQLHTKQGDYRKACDTYKDIIQTRDSINARGYSSQINVLQTIHKADQLKMNNQEQYNQMLSYLIGCCILILIISCAAVFYIHKSNKDLSVSQKKLEKARHNAENSIRAKSLLLSNMSHEIRTPLNALCGFSNILTESNIDSETRKQCNDIIKQNSDLLFKLIDDVVDLSCMEIGNMQFNFNNTDAVTICHNVVDTIDKIKQTAASVLFHSSLEKLELYTDETRLQQMLFNLLINATKFTTEGSITLTLEKQSESVALFAVTDTGCGIAPDKQKNIFNRFEKLNENAQGSGLGLSICQLITERFGGKMWIDADYTGGSRFLFTHPINSANETTTEAI